MIKAVLFTHDDMDGAGCAIVFNHAMREMGIREGEYRIISSSIADLDDRVATWNYCHANPSIRIYFADVCPSELVLKNIIGYYQNVYVFDHHKSRITMNNMTPNIHVAEIDDETGKKTCGTLMLYRHFASIIDSSDNESVFNRSLSKRGFGLFNLASYICAYDTYTFKEPGYPSPLPYWLNIEFKIIGFTAFVTLYSDKAKLDQYEPISSEMMIAINSRIEEQANAISEFSIADVILAYITMEPNDILTCALLIGEPPAEINELSNDFLQRYPECNFMAFVTFKNGECTWSFRTISDNLDLSKYVAVPLGGGGHAKACGAPLSERITDKLKEMLTHELEDHLHWTKRVHECGY